MVQWVETQTGSTLMSKVVAQINTEVASNPGWEAVTGITIDELMTQASQVVSELVSATGVEVDPTTLIRAYAMGFVVGQRYQKELGKTK